MTLCAFPCSLVWLSSLFACVEISAMVVTEDESERLGCDLSRPEWQRYYAAFDTAVQATASTDDGERALALSTLAAALLERTSNVSDIIACNVGIVAGYFISAHLAAPQTVMSFGLVAKQETGLPYRLLQMALIFIFTLRNGNKVPPGPGAAWGISERAIIPGIMNMKKTQEQIMHQRLRTIVPIAPSFRDPQLRIAVVSICAYPEGHPLDLPKLTPENRNVYTNRHNYALRLHMESPILGAHGLGLQHAKLATVLAYLQTDEFDWIAWFDCDSIIMNMNRTLESVIYQYTQRKFKQPVEKGGTVPVCGQINPKPEAGLSLDGRWVDSWTPPEVREEAAVEIEQGPNGSFRAYGHQFGEAHGQYDSDGAVVIYFAEGTVRGRFVVASDSFGDVKAGSSELHFDNGAVWTKAHPSTSPASLCREPCREIGSVECEGLDLDANISLLITEEGWGLSSANWLVKNSAWAKAFLNDALTAAHAELNLFGDQDGMIFHLINKQALHAAGAAASNDDPLDPYAVIVPQFELNSYDALNALTMDCDAFVEGDLLVTFPQCKDAEGCNDVFNLAAEYSKDEENELGTDAGAWWQRVERPPCWRRYFAGDARSLRVFGPRPVIREVFQHQRQLDGSDDVDE